MKVNVATLRVPVVIERDPVQGRVEARARLEGQFASDLKARQSSFRANGSWTSLYTKAPFLKMAEGRCSSSAQYITDRETCATAAKVLKLADTTPQLVVTDGSDVPEGCYYKNDKNAVFQPKGRQGKHSNGKSVRMQSPEFFREAKHLYFNSE